MSDTYKKDEKTTTFELFNSEDLLNKSRLDTELSKKEGHISYMEKDGNELKVRNNKEAEEDVLDERAVKTTLQLIYHRR